MTGERRTASDERTALAEWVRDQQDRQAIRELAAAYQRGCDGGWGGPSHADPAWLAALFAPDATYKIPQREQPSRGRDEIRGSSPTSRRRCPGSSTT
ncbi:hypothetical protein DLE60_07610 [Micromonospora globispora]|uniref:nuclear transport factor 2 family protein n=1 Tax=Micromonospora globispora TaxID=1450148 RepID=UPI000D6ED475|nr:hypothetical protein DLE60_07610 [Micromonospora globispora]RQW98969.1 hypothetical protein DKL51_09315 [Micromonospora globispora]